MLFIRLILCIQNMDNNFNRQHQQIYSSCCVSSVSCLLYFFISFIRSLNKWILSSCICILAFYSSSLACFFIFNVLIKYIKYFRRATVSLHVNLLRRLQLITFTFCIFIQLKIWKWPNAFVCFSFVTFTEYWRTCSSNWMNSWISL